MEVHRKQAEDELDAHGLTNALAAELKKFRIHMDKALASDYPLLGAGELFYFFHQRILLRFVQVLHPMTRTSYFNDRTLQPSGGLATSACWG